MIRSFTIGVPIYSRSTTELSTSLNSVRGSVDARCSSVALQPRTVRLTLPPPTIDTEANPGMLRSVMDSVRKLADMAGARWYCLPLDMLIERGRDALLDEVQTLILRDSRLFLNLIIADDNAIAIHGAEAAGRFVLSLARRSNNGIDNFRVGISAACPAGTPFFPFSRHEGGELAFSIAMETTPRALVLAHEARLNGWKMSAFQDKLIAALASDMTRIDELGRAIETDTGFTYQGLDGSYAPFPDGKTSVAKLVESLGPSPVGAHGTVFITSVLSDALKLAATRSGARTVGFNGVMYSVLEDNGLTDANNLRALSLEKLALLSTVCGCGIDMAPVPATMFAEDVTALVLDIATLAVRLRKPLGVRLLPIPHKAVNEYTQLNLDFLCDSRVMDPGISTSRPVLSEPLWRYGAAREAGSDKSD
jgi:uncharacterized protein (UPF0210 family)